MPPSHANDHSSPVHPIVAAGGTAFLLPDEERLEPRTVAGRGKDTDEAASLVLSYALVTIASAVFAVAWIAR